MMTRLQSAALNKRGPKMLFIVAIASPTTALSNDEMMFCALRADTDGNEAVLVEAPNELEALTTAANHFDDHASWGSTKPTEMMLTVIKLTGATRLAEVEKQHAPWQVKK